MTINLKLSTVVIATITLLFSCGTDITQDLNSFVELGNESLSEVEDFQGNLVECEDRLINYRDNDKNTTVFLGGMFNIFNKEKLVESCKTSISNIEAEQPGLAKNMTYFIEVVNTLESKSKELDKYLDDEDYKDDEAKKGLELTVLLRESINEFNSLYSLNSKSITKIMDANKKVDNSATGKSLANMEKDLNLINEIYEKTNMIEDVIIIEPLYQDLVKNAKAHAEEDTGLDVLKSIYISFYESSISNVTSKIKVLIRDAKANKIDEDELANRLNRILSDYNTAVESYNSFNEQVGYGIK